MAENPRGTMTITTKSYRKTEAMLLSAEFTCADIVMTMIALSCEKMAPRPLERELAELDPIVLNVSVIANRLDWDPATAHALLSQYNGEALGELGFTLCDYVEDLESGDPMRVALSDTLAAIIRGTGVTYVEAEDQRAMAIDNGSAAAVALVSRVAAVGGGILYRQAVTADEPMPELMAMAATLAADIAVPATVAVHDRYSAGLPSIPPVAAVIGGVLHGARVVVIANSILEAPHAVDELTEDESEVSMAKRPIWSALTHDGWKLASIMPHLPIAVLVPMPQDTVLTPRAASHFITAIGPLRRDRQVAKKRLHQMSNGRVSDEVADRVVDLWDGHSERARTAIDAVDRMIDGPLRSRRSYNVVKSKPASHPQASAAFTVMMEALAGGIAPHIWSPIKPQRKPKPAEFHRELFVCEPDASVLFSDRLRNEPSIRIMLAGSPGTGKSGAAAHIANAVLGMTTYDVKMADVLHYRLGAMERAIAKAFREAREQNAVVILDEADSIAQDRASASPGSVSLVTAITNALLLELDRHASPVILCSNFAERIDPAVKRRFDLSYEVKEIPSDLEVRAVKLLLNIEASGGFSGFGGDTVIADYVSAKRMKRLLGGGDEVALTAVRRARDLRLGREKEVRRIGF